MINIPTHKEIIGSDTLTTISISSPWRRLISEALQHYFNYRIAQMDDADIDHARNRFGWLLDDLYNPDVSGGDVVPNKLTARRTTSQAVAANTITALQWNDGDYDALNPTRLVVPENALVWIVINARMESVNASSRYMELWKNGAFQKRIQIVTSSGLEQSDIVEIDETVIGDYYELKVFANQASTIAVTTNQPYIKIFYVPTG